jgi:hypothetical protein
MADMKCSNCKQLVCLALAGCIGTNAAHADLQAAHHDLDPPHKVQVDRIADGVLRASDQRSAAALDNGEWDVWPPVWMQPPAAEPVFVTLWTSDGITDVSSGFVI